MTVFHEIVGSLRVEVVLCSHPDPHKAKHRGLVKRRCLSTGQVNTIVFHIAVGGCEGAASRCSGLISERAELFDPDPI